MTEAKLKLAYEEDVGDIWEAKSEFKLFPESEKALAPSVGVTANGIPYSVLRSLAQKAGPRRCEKWRGMAAFQTLVRARRGGEAFSVIATAARSPLRRPKSPS